MIFVFSQHQLYSWTVTWKYVENLPLKIPVSESVFYIPSSLFSWERRKNIFAKMHCWVIRTNCLRAGGDANGRANSDDNQWHPP